MKKLIAVLSVAAVFGGLPAGAVARDGVDGGTAETSDSWNEPNAPYVEPSEPAWDNTFYIAVNKTDPYRQTCLDRGYDPVQCQAWAQMYFKALHRALASEYDRSLGRIDVTAVARPGATYAPTGTGLPAGATERQYASEPATPC